jgi:hypothetical protein
MTQAFDKEYWESHWEQANGPGPGRGIVANPYLAREVGGLAAGAALDAGCGEGAEAIWLAASSRPTTRTPLCHNWRSMSAFPAGWVRAGPS